MHPQITDRMSVAGMLQKVRFNSQVECLDGVCGDLAIIIIAPTIMRLTYLVVSQIHQPEKLRIIPIGLIAESSGKRILLNLTWPEFTLRSEFIQRSFIRKPIPPTLHGDQDYTLTPAAEVVVRLEIPNGEVALSATARVYARHMNLGQVDEFQIKPTTGELVNLLVRRRLFWQEQILAIPAGEIEKVEDNFVYTKHSKSEIERFQAVPHD